jgi:hypothetical protein
MIYFCFSCGLRNHIESGQRALHFLEKKHQIYKDFISKNPDAFQASVSFSDWVKKIN